jgi:hypothetical protein
MIWAALAILLISMLGSGQETFFLTPKLKKHVKTYVMEKDRQKEIFVIMKESKKKQKDFMKTRKSYMKNYNQLTLDRNSTMKDHRTLIEEYYNMRQEVVDFSIDQEMAMKRITTEEEWSNIMNAILEKPTKDKASDKMLKTVDKAFGNVIQSCKDHISNPENRNNAVSSVMQLKDKVDELIPRLADLGYEHMDAIRAYKASKAEYEKISDTYHQMRKEIDDQFLEFRFELLEMTTEYEWNQLMKDINKLLKKDMIS